jgi:hypothetical protein
MEKSHGTAAQARDWKFTTSRREVDLAMMLGKISSPYVGNVIARSMRIEERRSITLDIPNLGQYVRHPKSALTKRRHPG